LPTLRIERTQVGDKVFFNECPAFPGLGSLNDTSLGSTSQFFFAQLQKIGGLLQIKSAGHSGSPFF
jgi:hypothetical protein